MLRRKRCIVGYEVRVAQLLYVITHTLLEIREREKIPARRVRTEVFLDIRCQVLIGEGRCGERSDNAPKVRFSATVSQEPEVEPALV